MEGDAEDATGPTRARPSRPVLLLCMAAGIVLSTVVVLVVGRVFADRLEEDPPAEVTVTSPEGTRTDPTTTTTTTTPEVVLVPPTAIDNTTTTPG